MKYIDMHNHFHELLEEEYNIKHIVEYNNEYIIVAVSDDLESSIRTLELSKKYSFIRPCIGIHPWSIEEASEDELNKLLSVVDKEEVNCLGEIGLDTIFVAKTINKQRKFFLKFLEKARDYNLLLNLHTAGTWNEVFNLLLKYDIEKAYFHWYTGPLDLLDEITSQGYYIGANPAWIIQKKHRRILEYAGVNNLITESDAPYKYKGIYMTPLLVKDTLNYLSQLYRISYEVLKYKIYQNYLSLFNY